MLLWLVVRTVPRRNSSTLLDSSASRRLAITFGLGCGPVLVCLDEYPALVHQVINSQDIVVRLLMSAESYQVRQS